MKKINTWDFFLYAFGLTPALFVGTIMAAMYHSIWEYAYVPILNEPNLAELPIYGDYLPSLILGMQIWFFTFVPGAVFLLNYVIVNWKNLKWSNIIFVGILHYVAIALLYSPILSWILD